MGHASYRYYCDLAVQEFHELRLQVYLASFYFHLFFFPAILLNYAQIFAHTKTILPTH